MFRNLQNDDEGFINEGLEVNESGDASMPSIENYAETSHTKIEIFRSRYNQESLFREMIYKKSPKKSFLARQCENINRDSTRSCISGIFPIFSWLNAYKKEDLLSDVISGCTVAVMHIPQGMGYALLANMPPVIGIYMAFFPVLLYVIFGTSRHNSMGTFAVISLMVGKVVTTYSSEYSNSVLAKQAGYSAIEVATLVCLIVGVIQLIMYVFRLGVLSFLLSECLVSGFTTGAAMHVLTSQVKDLLGIHLQRHDGTFELIRTYIEIFQQLSNINVIAVSISIITICILMFNNEFLKPLVAKKTALPIPIELIVVVSGTVLSRYLEMNDRWSVIPVGHIPLGFPQPTVPRLDLWQELLVDSFAIAFVSYSVSVSMGLIFGQKLKYEIDFNQELLAMGTGNIFGSFFSCFPFSASLSRSLIQQTVGGRTQLASIVSCVLLLFVLLWIGPFFEALPRCVLASVVVVALKGMLLQLGDFERFRKRSGMDAFVWMMTFLSVVILSIDIGLLIGLAMSILCIFCSGIKAHFSILGHLPHSDLYLDIESFQRAIEIPFVKIIRYSGSINYATKACFKNKLCDKLGMNLLKELRYYEEHQLEDNLNISKHNCFISNLNFKHLVIDFNALTNIDASSIDMLTELIKDFNKLNVKVSLICFSTRVIEIFMRNEFSYIKNVYPTIHDAIHSQ